MWLRAQGSAVLACGGRPASLCEVQLRSGVLGSLPGARARLHPSSRGGSNLRIGFLGSAPAESQPGAGGQEPGTEGNDPQ